ncbi:MAG: AAA family ATPase [Deltaproteobacteria bacterium]|nr:AAA family ATPase [Deltaproteobacteria bacterium]
MPDPRAVGRVVASVLRASGAATPGEVARANEALAAVGRPPIERADFTGDTPEALAPLVPVELRAAALELAYVLAGDEPIRRRLADAYAGLWREEAEAPAPARSGSRVVRWLIGRLPRHQAGSAPQEETMEGNGPYRGDEVAQPSTPAERTALRQRVERIHREFLQVVEAVERVIVGKRDVIERVLMAMAAKGHVLLVDVPGVGKTQLCKAIAASIDTRFGRIQFTPDLLPMDITGANVFDLRDKQFSFRPGPIFTHILLADEINRATPKTQSALLEVMEERCATIDGTTHALEEPFSVLATMNPIDHQGTYQLPAAQIDRFMVMLEMGMPSPEDEVKVLDYHLGVESPLASLQPVISRAAFVAWRETVPLVHVTPELKRAAVDYVNGLRRSGDESTGRLAAGGASGPSPLSPRATLAWIRASQARAMLAGREFVTMDDLLHVAPDVLRHRLWTDGATVRERLRLVAMGAAR